MDYTGRPAKRQKGVGEIPDPLIVDELDAGKVVQQEDSPTTADFVLGYWDYIGTPGIASAGPTHVIFSETTIPRVVASQSYFVPADLEVGGWVDMRHTITNLSTQKYVVYGTRFASNDAVWTDTGTGFGANDNYIWLYNSGAINTIIDEGIAIPGSLTPIVPPVDNMQVGTRVTRTTNSSWTITYYAGAIPSTIDQTTTFGSAYQYDHCHILAGTMMGTGQLSGVHFDVPVITHSGWVPGTREYSTEQSIQGALLTSVAPITTVPLEPVHLLQVSSEGIQLNSNVQTTSRLGIYEQLFGYPCPVPCMFYTCTQGNRFRASDAAASMVLTTGGLEWGKKAVPRFTPGCSITLVMGGVMKVTTAAADLTVQVYFGNLLVAESNSGASAVNGDGTDRSWRLEVEITGHTYTFINTGDVALYADGMFIYQQDSSGTHPELDGFGVHTIPIPITVTGGYAAPFGDLTVTAGWTGTINTNDSIKMNTCKYVYSGFN